MKFSTKAEYGLKAMVCLARHYPDQKNIKTICAEEHMSEKYLERLMGELRKKAIVTSQKGKSGGYSLSKKPSLIRVGDIVEILEGPITPMNCEGKKCSMLDRCPSQTKVWNKLGEQIKKTLYSIRLSELV